MNQVRSLASRRVGQQGQRVLMVHGWMVSSAVFDPVLAVWPAEGRQLVLPDLAGAGGSSGLPGPFTLEAHVADLVGVLDQLGWSDAFVVGHSMGGQLAQLMAAQHPGRVSGLALLNPVPLAGFALPEQAWGLFASSAHDRALQDTILSAATQQLDDAARRDLVRCASGVDEAAITDGLSAWTQGVDPQLSARIGCPAHVLATDDPFLVPSVLRSEVQRPMAQASFSYIQGPGHYPLAERPVATAAWLEAAVPVG